MRAHVATVVTAEFVPAVVLAIQAADRCYLCMPLLSLMSEEEGCE